MSMKYEEWFDYKIGILSEFVQKKNRQPSTYEVYKGENIGGWVAAFKHKNAVGKLSNAHFLALQDIGIDLTVRDFDYGFKYLAEFMDINGREPKQTEVYLGFNVGAWLKSRKREYKAGKLLQEREALLRIIGVKL